MQKLLRAKENRRLGLLPAGERVDATFLILLLLLLAVGLGMLFSASSAQSQYDTGYTISTRYLQKQAACALVGLISSTAPVCPENTCTLSPILRLT